MSQKWKKVSEVAGLDKGVSFESQQDGSVNLRGEHMDAIDATLESNATALATAQSSEKDLQTANKTLTDQLAAANTKVDTLTTKVSEMETAAKASTKKITDLEAKIVSLENDPEEKHELGGTGAEAAAIENGEYNYTETRKRLGLIS